MKKKNFIKILFSIGLSLCAAACNKPIKETDNSGEEEIVDKDINVTSISLDHSILSLDVDESFLLKINISPNNATNQNVVWTSDLPSVATVSDEGLVFAIKEGEAIITVTTIDGGYSDYCRVIVKHVEVAVETITLNQNELFLSMGDTYNLLATISPENADDKTIIWSSSNSSVASINSEGKITAVSVGEAIIYASSNNGLISASCNITVLAKSIAVTGVSLNYEMVELEVDDTLTLIETIEPYNATNQNVSWLSSNENVASVNNGLVTALSAGESVITVTTEDGNYTASCSFNVSTKEEETPYIPVESDGILTISEAGEYTLEKDYKQIYVNAPEKEVVVNMNGHTIENDENSPIYVLDCDSFDISATKNTVSYIKDTRSIYSEADDSQGKGAIYVANGDLKLKGSGELNIEANYYNGVHGKDDVKIQKLKLNINAVNHGIKGNDSITITSGSINIVCGGDALHSDNTDISTNGKQRGNITINGGTINLDSWKDAIASAYDANIEELDSTAPINLTIKTNKYSSYSGTILQPEEDKLYLKMNSSTYSNGSYTYAAYINGEWYAASYKGKVDNGPGGGGPGGGSWAPGGSSSSYYLYSIKKPTSATTFKLYRFSGSNVIDFSTSTYNAVSDEKTFNNSYDTIQITVSNNRITFGSWSIYSTTNNNKADVSAKGIKANNIINITSGTINITAYDDGIHANNDVSLENGSKPLGNVVIAGGNISVSASDDGIHADNVLEISGGNVDVTNSYEGIEGNVITFAGGSTYVYATDDGVNASTGNASAEIKVTGGFVDVTVSSSGDTDGVDSNGTYTQTGGVLIVKGPGSASGNTQGAAALDTDSTVSIRGGTLIVFGGIEQTPSYSGVTRTLCSSSTVSTGSRTVSFSNGYSYTTTLITSTRGCVVYSDNGSATLH